MENTEALRRVYQYFLDRSCSYEEAMDMVMKCPSLLSMSEESLDKKLTLMFNADTFYGIILCDGNSYQEYFCSSVLKNNPTGEKNYVAKNLIDAVEKKYLQKIMGIEPNDTLEEKLYKMKQLNFNDRGYKVK